MKATHNLAPDTTTDPAMNPAALLRGAAIYLRTHGWTKGQFFELIADTDGPFLPACASGAISVAATGSCLDSGGTIMGDDTPEAEAAIHAMRVLAAYLDPEYTGNGYDTSAIDVIGDWNDEKGRTLDEVIEALTEAANDWRAAHPTGGAR